MLDIIEQTCKQVLVDQQNTYLQSPDKLKLNAWLGIVSFIMKNTMQ